MLRESMATELEQLTGLARRFMAFIIERYPFAWRDVMNSLTTLQARNVGETEEAIEAIRPAFGQELKRRLAEKSAIHGVPDPTPRTMASTRLRQAADELLDACDGFFRRAALEASLTADERREILRGMILTRATDNKLKALFTSGDVRYANAAFQGKGFRSLGQEAIYAAAIRLRRGSEWQLPDGTWSGDVVAPLIRDLGAALAMRCDAATVRMALNAQMAKAGPPLDGKDLNIGDFARGILPPTAPLGIATLTIAGMALAFQREGTGRVAISFIGDGGVSLGEWHEAINLCAVRRLPAIFCVQNNQTALSTPIGDQTAVRVFADKAAGYGIPGITLDGTDPDAIAAAFTWAAERARGGSGPTLIELIAMRMCGHAHHDDMLYLGRDPHPSWDYPVPTEQGYVDRELYAYWAARDPIATYAARLEADGIVSAADVVRCWIRRSA
jgi:TPP-dependent pyruvate/acetoin dehydrogenase alpha subunit